MFDRFRRGPYTREFPIITMPTTPITRWPLRIVLGARLGIKRKLQNSMLPYDTSRLAACQLYRQSTFQSLIRCDFERLAETTGGTKNAGLDFVALSMSGIGGAGFVGCKLVG